MEVCWEETAAAMGLGAEPGGVEVARAGQAVAATLASAMVVEVEVAG